MAELQAGDLVAGKYRITGTLGAGAMGVVYRAEQLDAEGQALREVALKTMQPALSADPSFARRFLRETRIAASLQSPYVVTIYDAGRAEDGSLYFTMELVRGRTLRELIDQQGRLGLVRTCGIVAQICRALAEAHGGAEPFVHRDLKPANIFVDDRRGEDRVKVNDFGIAKLIGEETSALTVGGQSPGTPRYMAPEQWRGEEVDGRTDLYAVGIIFYECLSGSAPFAGPLETLMYKHLNERPPPISGAGGREAEEMIARLLAKDREERPRDARAVEAELERIAETAWATAEAKTAEIAPAKATGPEPVRTRMIAPQPTRATPPAPLGGSSAIPAAKPREAFGGRSVGFGLLLAAASIGGLVYLASPGGDPVEVAKPSPTAPPPRIEATVAPVPTAAPPPTRSPAPSPESARGVVAAATPTAASSDCDRQPVSTADARQWVDAYRRAVVAKDFSTLADLGVVRGAAELDAWRRRLESRRSLEIEIEGLDVKVDGRVSEVSFSVSQRWRDPQGASTVFDFDAEKRRLGRKDCRVIALP